MSARGWVESLGIEYSAAGTPDSTVTGIGWLTDPEPDPGQGSSRCSRRRRRHRAAEGVLRDLRRRAEPPPFATDPATRRQGPAPARPPVSPRSSEGEGDPPGEQIDGPRPLEARTARRGSRWPARTSSASTRRPSCMACSPSSRPWSRSHRPGDLVQAGAQWEPRSTSSDARPHRLDAVVDEIRGHGGVAHVALAHRPPRTTRP